MATIATSEDPIPMIKISQKLDSWSTVCIISGALVASGIHLCSRLHMLPRQQHLPQNLLVTLFVVQTTKQPTGRSGSASSHTSMPSLHSPSLHWYETHFRLLSANRARLSEPFITISTGNGGARGKTEKG
uniref:Uncharacterized protein n=1 Tax=Anopheles merus TaxID=30066 RepID=A0A182UQ57_ANOME